MDFKEKSIQNLKNMLGKKNIVFYKNKNTLLSNVLKKLREDYDTIILQDQGIPISYQTYTKKYNFNSVYLDTKHGLINFPRFRKLIKNLYGAKIILLLNSLPGFHIKENIKKISEICKENNILLINDITGSIIFNKDFYGDFMICAMGKSNPFSNNVGAFLATDLKIEHEKKMSDSFYSNLFKDIVTLEKRVLKMIELRSKFLDLLKENNFVPISITGINLICLYKNHDEKEKLISFADNFGIKTISCPKHIRVLENAISFELKNFFS